MFTDKIKDSIFKFLRVDNLVGSFSGYIETRLQLYKMEIREDVSKALSKALVYAVLGFFAFLFLIFFSVGLAHFINFFMVGSFAGYWIVAGIYAVAFLLVLLYQKPLYGNIEKRFLDMTKRKDK